MYKIIPLALILIVLTLLLKPPPPEPMKIMQPEIKYIIISKSSCPACINYKSRHENIVKELKHKYSNLNDVIIEDDEKKNNTYNIKFFPTFIIETNNKVSKLSMNTPATFENLNNVITKLI